MSDAAASAACCQPPQLARHISIWLEGKQRLFFLAPGYNFTNVVKRGGQDEGDNNCHSARLAALVIVTIRRRPYRLNPTDVMNPLLHEMLFYFLKKENNKERRRRRRRWRRRSARYRIPGKISGGGSRTILSLLLLPLVRVCVCQHCSRNDEKKREGETGERKTNNWVRRFWVNHQSGGDTKTFIATPRSTVEERRKEKKASD